MEIKQVIERYISAASNCTYNSFELFDDNTLIYGASNALMFYDLQAKKAIKSLAAHTSRVNCVRAVKTTLDKDPDRIITSSSNGEVGLWQKTDLSSMSYELTFCQKLCDASVPVCDSIETKRGTIIFGCISALSELLLFEFNPASVEVEINKLQSIKLKLSVALDMCFYNLTQDDQENIIIAVGMDNGSVVLYGKDSMIEGSQYFEPKITLRKHEDWVRCVVFCKYRNEIYLASGGEDSFISLWRFTTSELDVSEFEFQVHKFGKFNIVFDSIIMGHEGWINSLHWNAKNPDEEGGLISCSSDQSVIVWDKGESIWEEKQRFGTIGGQVPGGFGAKANDKFFAVCGFQGAIQIWKYDNHKVEWTLEPSITGHFGSVSDLDYDPTGNYIVTASVDQTTRAHSPWGENRWHEISRPQIHGHDIFTMKTLGDYIVSGAEEKILRVFQPTDVFQRNLENAAEIPVDFLQHVTSAATLPALGLSNLSEVPNELQESSMPHFSDLVLDQRLDEDFLRSQTLWPEVSKLYGHVYEISCIATSPADPLIASGSQSNKPQFSSIILWSAQDFVSLGEFAFHKLNVTDMEFSPSGEFLLSGSRDRTWGLWHVSKTEKYSLNLLESGSFHTRALWVTTWSVDSFYFVTGARDKKLACWTKNSSKFEVAASSSFPASVSAASVNPDNLLAVGLENGRIYLLHFNLLMEEPQRLSILKILECGLAHHLTVKRLKFNPKKSTELASAGADHFTRVYELLY